MRGERQGGGTGPVPAWSNKERQLENVTLFQASAVLAAILSHHREILGWIFPTVFVLLHAV